MNITIVIIITTTTMIIIIIMTMATIYYYLNKVPMVTLDTGKYIQVMNELLQ